MQFYSFCLLALASAQALPESSSVNLAKRGLIEWHRENVHERRMRRMHRFAELNAPFPVSQTQEVITTVDGAVVPGVVPAVGPIGPVIPVPPVI
jgi:hypothetical protein